jgi:hypothetical protein
MRINPADASTLPLAAMPRADDAAGAGEASPASSSRVAGTEAPSPFVRVLRGLGREIDDGEGATRSALQSLERGADLGPGRLIALQAGVYRYSEAIDLASRLVDRATSGVKTVVQGGGQ